MLPEGIHPRLSVLSIKRVGVDVTRLEAAAWAFTILNALRTIGYLPQLAAIWRDEHRATAISLSAWTLWTASHLSTAVYASEATGDRLMVAMMLVNAAFCAAIVLLTLHKRREAPALRRKPCAQRTRLSRPSENTAASLRSDLQPWTS